MIFNIVFHEKNLTEFLKLSGTPFNCADDITAYYEIEDCEEIDEFKTTPNGGCRWENNRNRSNFL